MASAGAAQPVREHCRDIENTVLRVGPDGTPVTVGHVARVREGGMLRIGASTIDGRGETVIGLVQMLAGENALDVATRARQALEALTPSLPKYTRERFVGCSCLSKAGQSLAFQEVDNFPALAAVCTAFPSDSTT